MDATIIKAIRLSLGETQEQFATRFGVHQSTIHDWENRGPPVIGTAAALIARVVAELRAPATRLPRRNLNAPTGSPRAMRGIPKGGDGV